MTVHAGQRGYTYRRLARTAYAALMGRISSEIEQDVSIWEHKEYAEHPVLTKGDRPIAAWRAWCQQLYNSDT